MLMKKYSFFSAIASVFLLFAALQSCFFVSSQDSTLSLHPFDCTSVMNKTNEWTDGYFTANWSLSLEDKKGTITGSIFLGRTDKQGSFHGILRSEKEKTLGMVTGVIYQQLILARLHLYNEKNFALLFGTIALDDSSFSAQFQSMDYGIIQICGSYTASFLPPLTGDFDIGIQSYHLVDSSREEYFTSEPEDNREMMIQIWYPTEKSTPGDIYEYMDPITFQWLKTQSPIPLFTIPSHAYQFINPHAKLNASIACTIDCYPVIIFSHGYDGVYQIYTSFIEDLVSNGFVVVSINHPYVAGITVFPDGETIEIAEVPDENTTNFFDMSLRSVIEDAQFVLDYITLLNQSEGQWKGRLNLNAVGMFGHSFGGAATSVCCVEDDRFKAGLTLDGVFYEDFITEPISDPFLMMFTRSRYFSDEGGDLMWNQLENEAYKIGINGSSHYSYTDVGLLLQHLTPLLPPHLLGFGSIHPKRMINISRNIELAFFDVYLRNAEEKNLENIFDMYNELLITKK